MSGKWVVIYDGSRSHGKEPYTMECRRCGETYAPTVPISVDVFVAMAKAFGRTHRTCRLRPVVSAEARRTAPSSDAIENAAPEVSR